MPQLSKKIASLKEQMAKKARVRLKVAAEPGADQDTTFEQAFSNLSHAYLQDKAPTLLDYEVGFQLLDRNQESTKAIGIMGFKVGPQWLYAPVFFLNGDLKGHELLYIKNQDRFVPLKENWLNHILNKRPDVLGSETDKNLRNIGVIPPHLYQLSKSPSKFASFVDNMSSWAKEALPTVSHWATSNPSKDKKYEKITDLPTFLKKEGLAVVKSLIMGFQENPKLASCFKQFHDLSVIDEAIKEARAREVEARVNSVLQEKIAARKGTKCVTTPGGPRCFNPNKPAQPSKSVMDTAPTAVNDDTTDTLKTAAPGDPLDKSITYAGQDSLRIFTYDDVTRHGTGLEGLTDKERAKLLNDKVLIKDERQEKEVVKAYEVTSPVKLQNPDETGLYDVLCRPNGFEKCYVIFGPYSHKGRKGFITIIKVEGGKEGHSWLNIHPSHVWVGNRYTNEDFQKWWKELPEPKELTTSKTALSVLIGNTGEGTLPFKVKKEVLSGTNKSYDVYFKDYASRGRASHLPPVSGNAEYYENAVYPDSDGERIVLTGKRGASLRSTGEDLYVPADYRKFELIPDKDDESEDYGCCMSCSDSSDPEPITLANQLDIDLLLGTKTASYKIYDSGTEVEINGKRMQKLAALIHLVRDWRFREKEARALLKRANEHKVTRFRVKKAAQTYDMQQGGPSAPSIPDAPTGYDPMTGGMYPTQSMGEWNMKIPEMSAANTDRSIYHPMGPEPDHQGIAPDHHAQQAGMQAAQLGQKEVFDTAMIGSLLKAVRNDSMVDRYMGDLMKGLDRLGRILFLFYWHNEKFADRYGKDEMVELEDGLRNAFEYLGDIVLFLEQRSINSDYHNNKQDVDLSEVAG